MQSIPQSQFLVITSERLRRHPDDTLHQVMNFIGAAASNGSTRASPSEALQSVPAPLTVVDSSEHGIDRAVLKHFPGITTVVRLRLYVYIISVLLAVAVFEKTTGWRLNSQYEPLDPLVEEYLEEFFAPFNAMLFRQLNVTQDSVEGHW